MGQVQVKCFFPKDKVSLILGSSDHIDTRGLCCYQFKKKKKTNVTEWGAFTWVKVQIYQISLKRFEAKTKKKEKENAIEYIMI